ncbi:MAG: hypothetical protein PHR45_05415 [Muribaculaceae bacterium]|nr:hypothetical protein [Muribaculaceae bacterium]
MKRIYFSIAIVLLCVVAQAQQANYKFGKVSKEELEMTSYDKDKDANAAILYEETNVYYDISNKILLVNEQFKRIKILKDNGKEHADFSIKYISNRLFHDYISYIDVVSYNLVNEKIVKTKLDKKMIFTEELSTNYSQKKFSAPNVKVGTVVE